MVDIDKLSEIYKLDKALLYDNKLLLVTDTTDPIKIRQQKVWIELSGSFMGTVYVLNNSEIENAKEFNFEICEILDFGVDLMASPVVTV